MTIDMDTRIIGGKIARARKAAGLSQARLAQQLFISPQAVGKWERGESMPDITTFNRLAEMLGVDLNYFSETESAAAGDIPRIEGPAKQAAKDDGVPSRSAERKVPVNLTAIDLQHNDFTGAVLHHAKFKVSPLQGANFTGADLTGSSFDILDAREANFDGANLTGCEFSIAGLADASFRNATLVRTTFNMSGQGAKFTGVTLTDVNFTKADLRTTIFEHCIFNGTDFNQCDLQGISFDGQTFNGVRFNKSSLKDVSFRGATLRNTAFKLPFSLTNKSHNAFKTACFDGAMMDMPTYAVLKSLRVVDLSKVTVI